MSKFLYFNTLYSVFTDGKRIWDDKSCSEGFIPKDRASIYFKNKGKIISRKQIVNPKFIVWVKKEKLPF